MKTARDIVPGAMFMLSGGDRMAFVLACERTTDEEGMLRLTHMWVLCDGTLSDYNTWNRMDAEVWLVEGLHSKDD